MEHYSGPQGLIKMVEKLRETDQREDLKTIALGVWGLVSVSPNPRIG